ARQNLVAGLATIAVQVSPSGAELIAVVATGVGVVVDFEVVEHRCCVVGRLGWPVVVYERASVTGGHGECERQHHGAYEGGDGSHQETTTRMPAARRPRIRQAVPT